MKTLFIALITLNSLSASASNVVRWQCKISYKSEYSDNNSFDKKTYEFDVAGTNQYVLLEDKNTVIVLQYNNKKIRIAGNFKHMDMGQAETSFHSKSLTLWPSSSITPFINSITCKNLDYKEMKQ